jgi:hypothetical protein
MEEEHVTYRGSCHCGAVRFEVDAPGHVVCLECNCSICTKSGYLHLIVPRSRFRLVQGEHHLVTYMFGTGVAKHYFCRTCGIKPFYVPRSNPDGIDVNVRCIDPPPASLEVQPFDGRNWEASAGALASLSREG